MGLSGGVCGAWWGRVCGRAGVEVSGGVNGLGLRENGCWCLIIVVFFCVLGDFNAVVVIG